MPPISARRMSVSVATTSSVFDDDVLDKFARNDHHAVAVAQQVVAGRGW